MPSRFYGLNRGQTEFFIVEGTATLATDIELRVDTGKGWTAAEVQQKLGELGNYVLKNTSGTMPGLLMAGEAAELEIVDAGAPPAEVLAEPPSGEPTS
jgi:hypothetical protein